MRVGGRGGGWITVVENKSRCQGRHGHKDDAQGGQVKTGRGRGAKIKRCGRERRERDGSGRGRGAGWDRKSSQGVREGHDGGRLGRGRGEEGRVERKTGGEQPKQKENIERRMKGGDIE